MLIRVNEDKSVVTIDIDVNETTFLDANPTGGYKSVESLPISRARKWKEVNGVIEADSEAENNYIQNTENNKNRSYLNLTDWYITRNTETGVAIPVDILTKRQSAREAIV